MVDDLEMEFDTVPGSYLPLAVHAALICIVCELPACRKVCGFTDYQAKLGYTKWLELFSSGSFAE